MSWGGPDWSADRHEAWLKMKATPEHSRLTHLNAPIEVGFELVPYCNLRCFHCFANASPDQPRRGLSLKTLATLFEELAKLRVFQLYLGGGEPFACHDILDILRLAADHSLVVCISTNGTCVTEKHLQALERLPPALIQVSLDGAGPGTNDRLKGGRSFEQAVRTLQRLRTAGMRTAIGTVACQANFVEIPDLLQLALDLQAGSFHLMGLQPAGRAVASYSKECLTENQWLFLHDFFRIRRRALGNAIDLRIEIDKYVLFKHHLFVAPDHLGEFSQLWCTCPCARRLCTITAKGDVLPCELMRDVIAGNVCKQSFREIWKHSAVLRSIRRRSLGIPACRGCSLWECCQGGCAAAVHNLTGSLTGADPRCQLAKTEILPA